MVSGGRGEDRGREDRGGVNIKFLAYFIYQICKHGCDALKLDLTFVNIFHFFILHNKTIKKEYVQG